MEKEATLQENKVGMINAVNGPSFDDTKKYKEEDNEELSMSHQLEQSELGVEGEPEEVNEDLNAQDDEKCQNKQDYEPSSDTSEERPTVVDDEPKPDEDDLEHVVDDVSDGEGDEEAGKEARKQLEAKEEKGRNKEITRRMREGYDGRCGGIASGIGGARCMHRFDELVAADNREDAKRLGLLNDDEINSEDEDEGDSEGKSTKKDDEEDDEVALLDKMLKDCFLHRQEDDFIENFTDNEEKEDIKYEKGKSSVF